MQTFRTVWFLRNLSLDCKLCLSNGKNCSFVSVHHLLRIKHVNKHVCLVAHHLEHGNMEQYTLLELFKGSPATALHTAADKGQLNDWLMSLAPMGEHPIIDL